MRSGAASCDLAELLERCTAQLQAHRNYERYKDDPRFLRRAPAPPRGLCHVLADSLQTEGPLADRVWIQYADCCADPKEVFDYLEANAIGQGLALFYEARAAYQELKANFAGAHATYEAGIGRQAAPAERLKVKFSGFQARMVKRIQRSIDLEATADARPPAAPTASRSFSVAVGSAAAMPPPRAAAVAGRAPTPAIPYFFMMSMSLSSKTT